MKKVWLEIAGALAFVFVGTYFVYGRLSGFGRFWQAQKFWSILLALGWVVVSMGYYHQGWKVRKLGRTDEISLLLPATVFVVQCVLFVKGIYYTDWSLIWGALVVNSGVAFSLYQIITHRHRDSEIHQHN